MSDFVDMTPPPASVATRRAPDYPRIAFGAGVLGFLGLITCGFGFIWMTVGFMQFMAALTGREREVGESMNIAPAAGYFFGGIELVVTGCLTRMAGQIALAVRDIARNSFR